MALAGPGDLAVNAALIASTAVGLWRLIRRPRDSYLDALRRVNERSAR